MDTTINAKRIGYKQAFKAITVGLVIAYLIMAAFAGVGWIFTFSYSPTLIFSALLMYGFGFLFGRITGKLIIINKYPSILLGIVAGFLIVCSATFIGSLIGFFDEGISGNNSSSEAAYDYILKPVLTISIWGGLPIILVGVWYGVSIKSLGEKSNIG